MDTHRKPIAHRIEWLMQHARQYSESFSSSDATIARQRYLAEHPSAIAALKCMDGRINLSVDTHTPSGIIQPFRNLGGMFDLGWPHLGEVLAHYVHTVVSRGQRVLMLITYHYSKGDKHRGCAGFNYDTQAGAHLHVCHQKASRACLRHRPRNGLSHRLRIRTDEEALILHGSNGELLDISQFAAEEKDSLRPRLMEMFPDMHSQIRYDLEPLVFGNMERIAELRKTERTLDIEHHEWVICVGRGFDFLHMPNLALIVGPYSPNLDDPIDRAAGIIEANMRAGRIPDDGFLLLASVPYQEVGVDRARAELKSRFLSKFASDVIYAKHPQLAHKMHMRTAVLDWRSRKLEIIAPE